jgi:enamine deaminase RidA (YjgF/YER057c/UK114 family)
MHTNEGREAVRIAALNALSAARQKLGSLDKVIGVVRLCVYIATDGDFFDHPRVADAASELFRDVFGEQKTSVRMVLGVASLPLGVPVAVEVILEVGE